MDHHHEFLGRMMLYHATNTDAGSRIFAGGVMLTGTSGMFGAGIYFAETREIARHKAAHDGGRDSVIIEAEVDMGTASVVENASPGLNCDAIHSWGCNSVKGRSNPRADWEYVVYDPMRIRIVAAEGRVQFVLPGHASPPPSYITGLTVVSDPNQGNAKCGCPHDYHLLDVDLCKGTKKRGCFVYLCYKVGSDVREAIGDIMLEAFGDWQGETSITRWHHDENKHFTRIPSDLNRGARGKFIFVSYSKQAPVRCYPITGINAIVCGESPPSLESGWEYATWQGTSRPADTNMGAGGPFIFISFKRG
jgi:hypothetical protein